MDILFEDGGYFDITTFGLGIGDRNGAMSFAPKEGIVLSGCDEAEKILKKCGLNCQFFKKNGENVAAGEQIARCAGSAKAIHHAWKVVQNIFEYTSGIATYTAKMTAIAREENRDIIIAATRKNFPGAKELTLKAVMDGGGVAHRVGLFDSVLVFKEHLAFFGSKEELEAGFKQLTRKFIEKKIAVEVEDIGEASYFAALGADILQCEKMDFETLKQCVTLKKSYPRLLVSATGGVTIENVREYAKTGVDFIVTSSPYHAKPIDIKVSISPL